MCTPSLSAGELSLQPNFQKGGKGLTGPQPIEGGCWERGDDFFQAEGGGHWTVCQFIKGGGLGKKEGSGVFEGG